MKVHKIRIRGADPNKLRLSTPYYLQKKDIDGFLEKFDDYNLEKKLASFSAITRDHSCIHQSLTVCLCAVFGGLGHDFLYLLGVTR